jgi:hypothetical protein
MYGASTLMRIVLGPSSAIIDDVAAAGVLAELIDRGPEADKPEPDAQGGSSDWRSLVLLLVASGRGRTLNGGEEGSEYG